MTSNNQFESKKSGEIINRIQVGIEDKKDNNCTIIDETKIYPHIVGIFERITNDGTKGLFVRFNDGIACLATKQNINAFRQCIGPKQFYATLGDNYCEIPDDDKIKTFLRAIVDVWVDEDNSDIATADEPVAVSRRQF